MHCTCVCVMKYAMHLIAYELLLQCLNSSTVMHREAASAAASAAAAAKECRLLLDPAEECECPLAMAGMQFVAK